MNYFNESNRDEAMRYLEEHGIKSIFTTAKVNNKIPKEAKITGQPLLDVANYIKSEELKGNNIIYAPQEYINELERKKNK